MNERMAWQPEFLMAEPQNAGTTRLLASASDSPLMISSWDSVPSERYFSISSSSPSAAASDNAALASASAAEYSGGTGASASFWSPEAGAG
jgi:hypothetical protein